MPLSRTNEASLSERPTGVSNGAHTGPVNQATLTAVADALSRLRYGAVHLTIHDGKVVQLDVTERQRFT